MSGKNGQSRLPQWARIIPMRERRTDDDTGYEEIKGRKRNRSTASHGSTHQSMSKRSSKASKTTSDKYVQPIEETEFLLRIAAYRSKLQSTIERGQSYAWGAAIEASVFSELETFLRPRIQISREESIPDDDVQQVKESNNQGNLEKIPLQQNSTDTEKKQLASMAISSPIPKINTTTSGSSMGENPGDSCINTQSQPAVMPSLFDELFVGAGANYQSASFYGDKVLPVAVLDGPDCSLDRQLFVGQLKTKWKDKHPHHAVVVMPQTMSTLWANLDCVVRQCIAQDDDELIRQYYRKERLGSSTTAGRQTSKSRLDILVEWAKLTRSVKAILVCWQDPGDASVKIQREDLWQTFSTLRSEHGIQISVVVLDHPRVSTIPSASSRIESTDGWIVRRITIPFSSVPKYFWNFLVNDGDGLAMLPARKYLDQISTEAKSWTASTAGNINQLQSLLAHDLSKVGSLGSAIAASCYENSSEATTIAANGSDRANDQSIGLSLVWCLSNSSAKEYLVPVQSAPKLVAFKKLGELYQRWKTLLRILVQLRPNHLFEQIDDVSAISLEPHNLLQQLSRIRVDILSLSEDLNTESANPEDRSREENAHKLMIHYLRQTRNAFATGRSVSKEQIKENLPPTKSNATGSPSNGQRATEDHNNETNGKNPDLSLSTEDDNVKSKRAAMLNTITRQWMELVVVLNAFIEQQGKRNDSVELWNGILQMLEDWTSSVWEASDAFKHTMDSMNLFHGHTFSDNTIGSSSNLIPPTTHFRKDTVHAMLECPLANDDNASPPIGLIIRILNEAFLDRVRIARNELFNIFEEQLSLAGRSCKKGMQPKHAEWFTLGIFVLQSCGIIKTTASRSRKTDGIIYEKTSIVWCSGSY